MVQRISANLKHLKISKCFRKKIFSKTYQIVLLFVAHAGNDRCVFFRPEGHEEERIEQKVCLNLPGDVVHRILRLVDVARLAFIHFVHIQLDELFDVLIRWYAPGVKVHKLVSPFVHESGQVAGPRTIARVFHVAEQNLVVRLGDQNVAASEVVMAEHCARINLLHHLVDKFGLLAQVMLEKSFQLMFTTYSIDVVFGVGGL